MLLLMAYKVWIHLAMLIVVLITLNEARQLHRKSQENLHKSNLESILMKFTQVRQSNKRQKCSTLIESLGNLE